MVIIPKFQDTVYADKIIKCKMYINWHGAAIWNYCLVLNICNSCNKILGKNKEINKIHRKWQCEHELRDETENTQQQIRQRIYCHIQDWPDSLTAKPHQ